MLKAGSALPHKSASTFSTFPIRTLKRRSDFLAMRDSRCFVKRGAIMLQTAVFTTPAGVSPFAFVGYTASRKVGNAVIRNRAKRRLRALVRENLHKWVLLAQPFDSRTERWRVSGIRFSKRTLHEIPLLQSGSEKSVFKYKDTDYGEIQRTPLVESNAGCNAYGFAFVFIATVQTANVPWSTLQNDVQNAVSTALNRMRYKGGGDKHCARQEC